MNDKNKRNASFMDALNRTERRKKGQRSGYQLKATLKTKPKRKKYGF